MDIEQLLNQDEINKVEEIHKGWSLEKKFYMEWNDEEKLLLRMAPISQFNRKVVEYDAMKALFLKGLPISEPLDIKGVEEEVYSLFKWVDGTDAEQVLPSLPEKLQYQLGIESGRILREIHDTICVPADVETWSNTYSRKIDQTLESYLAGSLRYENDALFLRYIEQNRSLIKSRPLVFQHGDYHTGNMILSDAYHLSIIDFNRWDYGDPWEEFNRIDFTAQTSPLFATGQLDGYFESHPPMDFFRLLLLYLSVNTLRALPWAQKYSGSEVSTMRNKAKNVLEWYQDLNQVIPSWYDAQAAERFDFIKKSEK